MIKLKKYLLLTSIFVASYLIAIFLAENVFIASTPKINPLALSNILNKYKTKYIALVSKFKFGTIQNSQKVVSGRVLNKVNAGYTRKGTYIKVDLEKQDYIDYTFNLNDGRQIKFKVPKGQNPPDQQMVEEMF